MYREGPDMKGNCSSANYRCVPQVGFWEKEKLAMKVNDSWWFWWLFYLVVLAGCSGSLPGFSVDYRTPDAHPPL